MQNILSLPDVTHSIETGILQANLKKARKITGIQRETDLAAFIPHGDGALSKEIFMRLKETDKKQLAELIKTNIIDRTPKRYTSSKVSPLNTFHHASLSLQGTIQKAMLKIGVEKESDLCFYIPYGDNRLHHRAYEKLKKTSPEELKSLIQEYILGKSPQRIIRKYSQDNETIINTEQTKEKMTEDQETLLQEVIGKALRRKSLKLKEEKDICKYIPSGERFLHPMAFRSLKKKNPTHLIELIENHVLNPKYPKRILWNRTSPTNKIPQNETFDQPQHSKEMISTSTPSGSTKTDEILERHTLLLEKMLHTLERQQNPSKAETHNTSASVMASTSQQELHPNNPSTDRYLRNIKSLLIKGMLDEHTNKETKDLFGSLLDQL